MMFAFILDFFIIVTIDDLYQLLIHKAFVIFLLLGPQLDLCASEMLQYLEPKLVAKLKVYCLLL